MKTNYWKALSVLLLLALSVHSAQASVVLSGTRVVYKSTDRDATIELNNSGEQPSLIQAWIDAGETAGNPETLSVPFVLTPPISRIDPKQSQTLRLVYTGETLPADRESVFWLNVLEIPPKPDDIAVPNRVQFSIRTRIKIFFRPKELTGSPVTVAAQLQWHPVPGKPLVVMAKNPSPYYLSVSSMRLVIGGKPVGKPMLGMVPPFSELSFTGEPEDDKTPLVGVPGAVSYVLIDDLGGGTPVEVPLLK